MSEVNSSKGVSEVSSSALSDFASVFVSVSVSDTVLGERVLSPVESKAEHEEVNCGP